MLLGLEVRKTRGGVHCRKERNQEEASGCIMSENLEVFNTMRYTQLFSWGKAAYYP